ncbi:MAG: ParB/RepB/Spo0J family partition protein [Clostridiales bacterium]|jgi:ParB family chromosome partitioning protein|nr:ParB/RepB/Spo0J family partition protein [Clostridiales bacterium]
MKKGLGRGLGALIAGSELTNAEFRDQEKRNSVIMIDINRIEPNKAQPRKYFDEEALEDLAESIKTYGILQPIIVKEEGEYYSIIAGERRWRAARIARLSEIPVMVKDYTASDALQIALIENLQRQDLTPIEEALCFRRLIDDFFYTQEDIAKKIGKDRSSVSYTISLLTLDSRVQEFINEGKLSAGHGRVLAKLHNTEKQLICAEHIIERDLNIRDTESMVKNLNRAREADPRQSNPGRHSFAFKHIEDDLKSILGTKVSIKNGKKKGSIEIEYYSMDELDRLLEMLKRAGGQ